MGRQTLLTPELIKTVCDAIRFGAYDYVAAEAAGIAQSTFYAWLQDANEPDADPLKIEFSEAVLAARAEARCTAERLVFADKPEIWLLKGPGRERPGREGWASENTVSVKGAGPITLSWGDDEDSNAEPTSGTAGS